MKRDINDIALEAFSLANKHSVDFPLANLLTTKEKVTIGRRLLIAQAILAGKTRMEINNQIHVSPNTFAQINRWLESNQKSYFSTLSPSKVSRKHISRYTKPFTYEDMERRYPGHFLLFTLVKEIWETK
jgi:uncharacterized protein YerC